MKKLFIFIISFFISFGLIIGLSSCKKVEKTYDFVFYTNNSLYVEPLNVSEDSLANFELPNPVYDGYTFEGWYFDKELTKKYEYYLLGDLEQIELYAKWNLNKYKVMIHYEDDIEYEFDYNEVIKIDNVEKEDCEFDKYYFDEELTKPFDLVLMPSHNIDLYPSFSKNVHFYNVNYVVDNDKGYLNGDSEQYIEENHETTEVEVKELDGYRFIGWNDGNKDFLRIDKINDDLEVEALFEEIYTLEVLNPTPAGGKIDGETKQLLTLNEESSVVKAIPSTGYKFVGWSNGIISDELSVKLDQNLTVFPYFVIDNLKLQVMAINVEDNATITSKEYYSKCYVSVLNSEYQFNFDNLPGKIKGRGNSTWTFPKKPYKLKFDSKVDLFGNGKAKTWTLIANYNDKSLIRNQLAYSIGELLESDYVTSIQTVELYLNGEYEGIYLVCEQNEVGKTRVNISESLDGVNTGYLLELDNRDYAKEGEEDVAWFQIDNGYHFIIKSPDVENELYSTDFSLYIKDYLNKTFEALESNDIEEVKKYLDLNSFARSYIIHELFNCCDVGWTSFYIFKDSNGLIKSGPIWDFDVSSGNCNYNDLVCSTDSLWAKESNLFYEKLYLYDDFKQIVSNLLVEYKTDISKTIDLICEKTLDYCDEYNRNFKKWEILGLYVYPNPLEIVKIDTWQGQIEYLNHWLKLSLDFIYNEYVSD